MKQNLKPFDLRAALAGKPVVTRDGRPVKIAGYNEEASEYHKITGWIEGCGHIWNTCGEKLYALDDNLFMAPEKREVWVCLYRVAGTLCTTAPCSTEQEAIKNAFASKAEIIATVKIWEEEI